MKTDIFWHGKQKKNETKLKYIYWKREEWRANEMFPFIKKKNKCKLEYRMRRDTITETQQTHIQLF